MSYSATIIGAGNTAWHLARAWNNTGYPISEMVIKNPASIPHFTTFSIEKFVDHANQLTVKSDFCFLCVPDEAIEEVAQSIPTNIRKKTILVHMSGSLGLAPLLEYAPQCGCLWPVQTLSIGKPLQWADVPVIAVASNSDVLQLVKTVGMTLGPVFSFQNEESKRKLHLAAVMSGNFIFKLLQITKEYCDSELLNYALLHPLIRESLDKGIQFPSPEFQTGPAARGDEHTLAAHRELLRNYPELLSMYDTMTLLIQSKQK